MDGDSREWTWIQGENEVSVAVHMEMTYKEYEVFRTALQYAEYLVCNTTQNPEWCRVMKILRLMWEANITCG